MKIVAPHFLAALSVIVFNVGDYNNARIIVDTSASHASPTPPIPPPAIPHP